MLQAREMASALLLRILPLRSPLYRSATACAAADIAAALTRRHLSALSDDSSISAGQQPAPVAPTKSLAEAWMSSANSDYSANKQWKAKKAEMLNDVMPTVRRTKEILHSNRYLDGATLSKEDEELVVEKLLAHHPYVEDKIGCGLQAIMVDTHPRFNNSRCLFVVRTDGGWIDFSYQKCLMAYIRKKYPTYAERFIRDYFKRCLK